MHTKKKLQSLESWITDIIGSPKILFLYASIMVVLPLFISSGNQDVFFWCSEILLHPFIPRKNQEFFV